MNDLKFISGEFFDLELPKEDQYLFKYFSTDAQLQFLRYYYTFHNYTRFREHTGYTTDGRWLKRLKRKYKKLVTAYAEAKKTMDLKTLAEIQMGKYKACYK